MRGIVAAVAPAANIVPVLLEGLRKLEYRSRELYVLADANSHFPETEQIHVLQPPEHHGGLSPIPLVVALQLLAYRTALAKGTDVDKPRTLAKSVTVE